MSKPCFFRWRIMPEIKVMAKRIIIVIPIFDLSFNDVIFVILYSNTKLVIFSGISKKNFQVVDAEEAAVAGAAAFAGGQYLDIGFTQVRLHSA